MFSVVKLTCFTYVCFSNQHRRVILIFVFDFKHYFIDSHLLTFVSSAAICFNCNRKTFEEKKILFWKQQIEHKWAMSYCFLSSFRNLCLVVVCDKWTEKFISKMKRNFRINHVNEINSTCSFVLWNWNKSTNRRRRTRVNNLHEISIQNAKWSYCKFVFSIHFKMI